jgi:hypothetical protein
MSKRDQRFSPIPARAGRDQRLGARHWRALHIIGLHDQLDRNGPGCWASQRRLADLLGVDKVDLSHVLTDLRDYGYLNSKIHPTDRRRRVYRIVYNEQDINWDRNSCRRDQLNSCQRDQPSGGNSWSNQPRSLVENGEIVGDFGPQNDPISLKSLSETSRTYVNIKEHIRKTDLIEGTDCAEARLQGAVTEAEKHLTELEALAVSKDRELLQWERPLIEKLVNDACLPEALNERAARLLHQIDQGRRSSELA